MQLIGMLDSPYVRRVAVSLQLMGVPFDHRSLSVFRGFDAFRSINPVVKAPTLVCDDGTVLMDSTLILDFAEALPGRGRSLLPTAPAERLAALRATGLALAACEKSVAILYERVTRPPEKAHDPWLQRVTGQLLAAYRELEADVARRQPAVHRGSIDQAGVTAAVAWHFTQRVLPEVVAVAQFPALQDFSARAEALPEFQAAPHGEGTYRGGGPTAG